MSTEMDVAPNSSPSGSLSYKFERLREKLRQAIASGEISGKLPGERILARKYHVNAKTLSKALTDLAAEGLLDRSIGRGTYVKGHEPVRIDRRWLLLCSEEQRNSELVSMLREAGPELDVLTDVSKIRPSFLGNFNAVIDLSPNTPAEFLRQLAVRNFPVVSVGKLPQTFSTHAVIFDGPLAVAQASRDLLLGGHRHLAAIELPPHNVVLPALTGARARYEPDATVEVGMPSDVPSLIAHGVTAFVCQSCELGSQVHQQLNKLGAAVPGDVSLMAIGSSADDQPCSGYFVHYRQKIDSIVTLLADTQAYRPTTLWLAGRFIDRGTAGTGPNARHRGGQSSQVAQSAG